MDRRDFLRTAGGLAAVATGTASSAAPAAAAPGATESVARTLTFAFPWRAEPAGYADDAHRIARTIEAALPETALKIEAQCAAGADLMFAHAATDVALHPAFAYFAGLPGSGAMAPSDLDAWLATAGGQDLWDALAAPHGFKPILAGHTGAEPVLWSKRKITEPQDLAGLRILARGLDAEIARALGALPITGSEPDLEAALASPDTDAVVWGGLVHASAADIPARFPHGLAGAFGSGGAALVLKIARPLWHSLSPAGQSALTAAVGTGARAALADAELTRSAVQAALVSRTGAMIARPSSAFEAAVSRIVAAVVAHTAAHDADALRIDRTYASYLRALAPVTTPIA